jgi:hypothetical protein
MAATQHLKTVNGNAGLHSEQDRTRGGGAQARNGSGTGRGAPSPAERLLRRRRTPRAIDGWSDKRS